jgi:hypothetical protein
MNIDDENFPGVSTARRQADLARLLEVTSLPDSARARARARWGTRGVVATGAATVVLVGGGVATAAAVQHLTARHATVTTSGRCYWEVSSDAGEGFPGTSAAMATSSDGWRPDLVEHLVADCAALWRAGVFQVGSPGSHVTATGRHPVPELTACVLPDGSAAVYPGPVTVCDALGLAPLAS